MPPSETLLPPTETAARAVSQINKQGPGLVGGWLTDKLNWVANKSSGVCRTVPTLLAYAVVHVLMRIAPDRQNYRNKIETRFEEPGSRDFRRRYGYKLVGYFVSLYRRSLLRNYLHRTGDPCRFIPSCSEYAVRATRKYGFWRGLMLTGDRFRRCTPSYRGDHWVDFP